MLETRFQVVRCPLVPIVSSLEVCVLCIGLYRAAGREPGLLLRGEPDLNLLSDGPRYIGLQGEHVTQVALVVFRPQVPVGGTVNELSGDPDAIAGAQDRAQIG